MPQNGGMNPGQPAPVGGMAPSAPPSGEAAKKQIEEGANIAMQGGMQAAEAAHAAPDVPETAAAKIEEGVALIAEGKEEAMAQTVAPQQGQARQGNPVEGTGAQATGTKEGG